MRFLATLIFFPFLWLRGLVAFILGIVGGMATIALVALAVAAWFLPRNRVNLYIRHIPFHNGHLSYWQLVAVALGLSFGCFMARYMYDWFLLRLHSFRHRDPSPWKTA